MLETLRKFGLEHCDLPTMLWNVSVLLRVLTLNIDKRYKRGIPFIFYITTTVISVAYFYVYLVSMCWFVFVRCPETGDVVAAMVVFSLGIASEIGTAKLIYMFINQDLIRDLVEGCLHCDSIVIPGSRFETNIRKTLRIVKIRAMIFWIALVVNGILYCTKPIVLPGRHQMEDSLIMYGLEPMFESPNFEIAYSASACGVLFTVYLPANITAFFIVVTGYTEAQILALSEELTHLWKDAQLYYENAPKKYVPLGVKFKNYALNEYIKSELTNIIKRHTMNINLLRQVEVAFKGAIAIEFTLLVIGLIAELLGGLENTYLEIPFSVVQVAMDCLVGQRVIDASNTFENAVYDSKWENFDTTNMKTVLLVLQNSQRTLTLSAGGVTMLSFTSLMAILKSVYSAYTTLHSAVHT